MDPSSVPLPSSTRTSSLSSVRGRLTSSVGNRDPTRRVVTGKWPTTARPSKASSTDEPSLSGHTIGATDQHGHDASLKSTGESFLNITDSSRSNSVSSVYVGTRAERRPYPSRPTSLGLGDKGKSPLDVSLHPDSTSQHTLADITVRADEGWSPGPRSEVGRGSSPTTGAARGVGSSMGERGPPQLEEGPPHRPMHLEARGAVMQDPQRRSHHQGKTVDNERGPGALEPSSLPTRLLREEAPPLLPPAVPASNLVYREQVRPKPKNVSSTRWNGPTPPWR